MEKQLSKSLLLKLLAYLSPIVLFITLFFNAITVKIPEMPLVSGELSESFNSIKIFKNTFSDSPTEENIFQFIEYDVENPDIDTLDANKLNYMWIFLVALIGIALFEVFLISIKSTSTAKVSLNVDFMIFCLSEILLIIYLIYSQSICNDINKYLTDEMDGMIVKWGTASTALYIPLILHSILFIGALACRFVYNDGTPTDIVQNTLYDIQDGTAFSFSWMIFGYIILGIIPIVRFLDMAAVALGLVGCCVYFIPLLLFKRMILNAYESYLDIISHQINSHRLIQKDAITYQQKFEHTLKAKKFWAIIGVILFIIILTISVIFVFTYKSMDGTLARIILNPSGLVLTGMMCAFPSLLYSNIYDIFHCNDMRNKIKNYTKV